jgi:hypothetical protein
MERLANLRQDCGNVAVHLVIREAEYAVADRCEVLVSASVAHSLLTMVWAVHLDDELASATDEVEHDLAKRVLCSKSSAAEPPALQVCPQPPLGRRQRRSHSAGNCFDLGCRIPNAHRILNGYPSQPQEVCAHQLASPDFGGGAPRQQ